MPADGDIIVPIRTVSVIGTTDIRSEHPDDLPVTQEEVDAMLADGERLVPGFRGHRALRVWAGVRPLFDDKKAGEGGSTRDVSRGTALLDHGERDGVGRFITITGGKLTTYRLMAEEAVDAMVEQLGHDRPCLTKTTPLPGSETGAYMSPGDRLRARDRHLKTEQLICECELIERSTLEATMRARGTHNLDDIRRSLRLGMGPCQGGFCIPRATAILHAQDRMTAQEANATLRSFLQERWHGIWPILYGDQLRQARLDDWIFQGILDVDHLPDGEAAS
jgi:glycerol-3-phosphate dehydrogenase